MVQKKNINDILSEGSKLATSNLRCFNRTIASTSSTEPTSALLLETQCVIIYKPFISTYFFASD